MMTEEERKNVYMSLLTGVARRCQDRLCAADEWHDWGPWVRFQIRHDDAPIAFDPNDTVKDTVVRFGATRKCENCGKEQRQ